MRPHADSAWRDLEDERMQVLEAYRSDPKVCNSVVKFQALLRGGRTRGSLRR